MVESDDKETAVVTPAQPEIPATEPVANEVTPAVTEKEVVAPEPAETEILLAKTEEDDKKVRNSEVLKITIYSSIFYFPIYRRKRLTQPPKRPTATRLCPLKL